MNGIRPEMFSTIEICCHFAGVDVPMPYATTLEAAALPQVGDIVKAVKTVLKVK